MHRTLVRHTIDHVGTTILLQGWVNTKRDHGKITFIDLRDRTGLVQVVGDSNLRSLKTEDVVAITGLVKKRPDNLVNPKLATGIIEIAAQNVEVINHANDLPLPIDTDGHDIEESIRLKYRYLDLRRPRLQQNIRLRSQLIQAVREYLFTQDFVEIETPLLTKSTPEGSRDFVVPSRIQPGKFYALPQSPQQYKQLLMVAGFERYFQIAKCFRDEDLRADRGFEHTQIDLELSFVDRQAVMALDEALMIHVTKKLGFTLTQEPFPIFTYDEAMKKFGADKFDLRTEAQKQAGELAFAWVVDFPFFEKTSEDKWTFTHNPFSLPKSEYVDDLLAKRNLGSILTTQYDLVCNGYEVGGGSIRAHKPEILRTVFEIIGLTPENIATNFGHMLEAFSYGAPPHGGLAHGVERLLMVLTGESYLREVQAFPQTGSGQTAIMDAPAPLEPQQLQELGLKVAGSVDSTKSVFDQIVHKLEDLGIKYRTFEHPEVFTSEEARAARGTSLAQGAKALLLIGDKQPLMAVISATTKLDSKAFKKCAGIKDLRFATPEEVEQYTLVKIGAVAPFGSIGKVPTYVDEQLGKNTDIVFNAGRHDRSILIKYTDYIRAEQPIVGAFSVS